MKQKARLESADPRRMLEHLGDGPSDRKLRLFSCACCWRARRFARDKRLAPLLLLLEGVADNTVKEWRREPGRERSYRVTQAKIDDSQQCIAWEIWCWVCSTHYCRNVVPLSMSRLASVPEGG
jgi:hypothetical protein